MSEEKPSTPDVIAFPPVIALATIVSSVALQWFWPLGWLSALDAMTLRLSGALVFVLGLAFLVGAVRVLKELGTNIKPSLPATALADTGMFRWTRNPMYVGGSLIMLAIALVFAIDWLLVLFVPSQLVLFYGVIRPEERYLASAFGDRYRSYAARVPRYLAFF